MHEVRARGDKAARVRIEEKSDGGSCSSSQEEDI